MVNYMDKTRLSWALIMAIACTSCSSRSINPSFSDQYERSALEAWGYGFVALAAGATAPISCGADGFLEAFRHIEGQGAIAVYFFPFTTLYGVTVGALKAVPTVGLGFADIATLGLLDLSAEQLYADGGLGRWCGCPLVRACGSTQTQTPP